MRQADGDDVLGISGIGNADVAIIAHRTDLCHLVESAIARSRYDYNAIGDNAFALLANGRAATGIIRDVVR